MTNIKEIKKVISQLHECEADYLETVPVKETFEKKVVWEGEVEVFNLRGHLKALRCYAWSHAIGEDDAGKRIVTVLELPPVVSAQTAVKAAIIQESRARRSDASKGKA